MTAGSIIIIATCSHAYLTEPAYFDAWLPDKIWTDHFLANDGLLDIADAYGVQLFHRRRQGRDKNSEAKKGLSNQRWNAIVKVFPTIGHFGVSPTGNGVDPTSNDKHFHSLIADYSDSAVLADPGFHGKTGAPNNRNEFKKCRCNARFLIETVFLLWVRFFSLKRIAEREAWYVQSHLSFAIAAFNCVREIFASQPDENGRNPLTMACICL